MLKISLMSLLLTTSIGCVNLQHAKGYPGTLKEASQTATLMGDWFVKIVTLDGKELSYDQPPKKYTSLGGARKSNYVDRKGFRLSLAPGYHTLSFKWDYTGYYSASYDWNKRTLELATLKFYVEPGKSYYIHTAPLPKKNEYVSWIEEVFYEEMP